MGPLNFSEGMYARLQEQISDIKGLHDDVISHAKASGKLIRGALDELRAHYADISAAELLKDFQMLVLPKFMGLGFYFKELVWLEYSKPIASNYELMLFYKQQVEFVRLFFSRHSVEYQLHKMRMMELEGDDLLEDHQLKWVEFAPEDSVGLERYDMSARFIGYEHLLKEMLERLKLHEEVEQVLPRDVRGNRLKWTGKLVNLVELAYGLYETSQINNGDARLSDIMNWLTTSFQVNIKSAYRVFDTIKQRKRLSHACFLDEMRKALLNRVEMDNEYFPGR